LLVRAAGLVFSYGLGIS